MPVWALNLALGVPFLDPSMAEKGTGGMRKAGPGAPRGVRRGKGGKWGHTKMLERSFGDHPSPLTPQAPAGKQPQIHGFTDEDAGGEAGTTHSFSQHLTARPSQNLAPISVLRV